MVLLCVAGKRVCQEESHEAGRVAVQASHGNTDASCLFSHALHERLPFLAKRWGLNAGEGVSGEALQGAERHGGGQDGHQSAD